MRNNNIIMYKINLELLVNDFSSEVNRFMEFAMQDLDVSSMTDLELEPLKDELFKFYTTVLIEAVSKSITDEERVELDSYLELHPDVNPLEVYITYGVANPDIDKILNESFDDAFSSLKVLKNNLK
jgi:hypothetical protein